MKFSKNQARDTPRRRLCIPTFRKICSFRVPHSTPAPMKVKCGVKWTYSWLLHTKFHPCDCNLSCQNPPLINLNRYTGSCSAQFCDCYVLYCSGLIDCPVAALCISSFIICFHISALQLYNN